MEIIRQFQGFYRDPNNIGEPKIGFIGNGNMCKAIITGILKEKLFEPCSIVVSGRDK
jgi:hypothetical protein